MNTKDINAAGCATRLCTEMVHLKEKQSADHWLVEDAESREIFFVPLTRISPPGEKCGLMTHKAA